MYQHLEVLNLNLPYSPLNAPKMSYIYCIQLKIKHDKKANSNKISDISHIRI